MFVDMLCVLVFVMVGRDTHDEGTFVVGTLATATPFLLGMLLTWLVLMSRWRDDLSVGFGAGVWVGTVVVGMLARRFVFDDGTAASFVVVATIFLGLTLVGWRLVANALIRRRAAQA
jgi:hypothetical protein